MNCELQVIEDGAGDVRGRQHAESPPLICFDHEHDPQHQNEKIQYPIKTKAESAPGLASGSARLRQSPERERSEQGLRNDG